MIRTLAVAAALALAAGAALAIGGDRRMTADEAEAFIAGRTLVFAQELDGEPVAPVYGAEQYLPGREAVWQYPDGGCTRGAWRVNGDALCFAYADDPNLVLCWGFWEDDRGVFARLVNSPQDDRLRVVRQLDGPLQCDPTS